MKKPEARKEALEIVQDELRKAEADGDLAAAIGLSFALRGLKAQIAVDAELERHGVAKPSKPKKPSQPLNPGGSQ